MSKTPPHLDDRVEPITVRTGSFWVPGEQISTPYGTLPRGPLYVEWMSPVEVTRPYPLLLVHGGGGQGTDWLTTPDGRQGWAYDLVRAGYAVYVVDRPGHGRSPHHPDVLGDVAPPLPLEFASFLFAPPEAAGTQTQWPWDRTLDGEEFQQLTSAMGFFMADFAEAQRLDGERLAALLDRIGPAVLITHSAGSPGGWLAANRRPELVKGIVAVEPMGPPYAEFPGLGEITYGLTYAELATEPAIESPEQLKADPSQYRIPGLSGTPVGVVTGSASGSAAQSPPLVEFLRAVGADAALLALADAGIVGNGHGLILEANSSDTVKPVIAWLERLETDLSSTGVSL
ncbi:alpha/beta fold hydrolase [Streptomyces sp. V4I2]|uniref:alpha/beta fold hydrolase n=1 Tax=Streptomyces sp. V4I2 TaxID=3042280 RepID=UPI0027D7D238|nr:alpha/beta fold hydrolase [Streptomyces sp. V4I2]